MMLTSIQLQDSDNHLIVANLSVFGYSNCFKDLLSISFKWVKLKQFKNSYVYDLCYNYFQLLP